MIQKKIFFQSKAAYVLVYQKRGTWNHRKSEAQASATATSDDSIEINGSDSDKNTEEGVKMEVN